MSLTVPQDNMQYLQSLSRRAGAEVNNAVRVASNATGVDFAYLLEQAAVESSFDTDAAAKTSSARGLFQFIESTWLNTVREHGEKYGLAKEAAAINEKGGVDDADTRRAILDLRNDPKIASLMAAELAADNKVYLEKHYDGEIGSTELYMAHFLGAGNAAAFLNAAKDTPYAAAADIFPKAAMANRNVFYDKQSGTPKSVAEVYSYFDEKFSADDIESKVAEAADIPRRSKQPLRDFIGQMPFEADVARARALGAIVADSLNNQTATSLSDDNQGKVSFNIDPSRSLFEQLQYRHYIPQKQSAAVELPVPQTLSGYSNEDYLSLFTDKV
ncbi:MAG: hypothetical protein VYC19_11035 [Pseudomonadota bacterium]|nr:hypothetical protein [Pseudomonadota bacterium]MEC9235852.1 hypothetical protein [Pseudomonadota bacterium]